MFIKISEELPPEGEEVVFITKRDKERVFGSIYMAEDARTKRQVPFVKLKNYSSWSISYEILELGMVTHWADSPEYPIEAEVDRFDLLDFDE